MATRQIIEIDEAKCTGCGLCETGCPEGALRIIDGKARLVGENLCDGLGACIGNCPFGAITVVEREAEAYEEEKVIAQIAEKGPNVVAAHLDHLRHHGQDSYIRQAEAWLRAHAMEVPAAKEAASEAQAGHHGAASSGAGKAASGRLRPSLAPAGSCSDGGSGHGCPGSRTRTFGVAAAGHTAAGQAGAAAPAQANQAATTQAASALSHWPIQLHLINPRARHFEQADLLVAADCTAFALGSFHGSLLEGKKLVIACPKLDQGRDIYLDKLAVLLESARTVIVAIMEVPCCSGLLKLVMDARERISTHKTIEVLIAGIEGGIVAHKRY